MPKSFENFSSLSTTVDTIEQAHFWQRPLTEAQGRKAAARIASSFGKPHAYADTFALSDAERRNGWKLFTGERVQSAAARHIAGEEACRALRLLDVSDKNAKAALNQASGNLLKCLERAEADNEHRMGGNPGVFCCGACTISVWRHILAGGFDRREERLVAGLKKLKAARNKEDGRWSRFPFWYTVSALVEMDSKPARAELQYVAPLLKRSAGRAANGSAHSDRQREIARRALNQI